MSKIKLIKEEKKHLIDEIKDYFGNERDEDIGDLQGDLILDFILEKIAPSIYNQAVSDMKNYMEEKIDDMYGFMI